MITKCIPSSSVGGELLYLTDSQSRKKKRPESPVLIGGQPLLLLALGILSPHLPVYHVVVSYKEPLGAIGLQTVTAESHAVLQLRLGLLPSRRIAFAMYVHERIDKQGERACDVHTIAVSPDLLTGKIFPLFARTRQEHEMLSDFCRLLDVSKNRANPRDPASISLEHNLPINTSTWVHEWLAELDAHLADWLRAGLYRSREDVLQAISDAGATILFVSHTAVIIQPPNESEKPIKLRGGKYSAEFKCQPAVASAGQPVGLSNADRVCECENLVRAISVKFAGRTKASERFVKHGDFTLLGKSDDVLARLLGQNGIRVEVENLRMGSQGIGGVFGPAGPGTAFAKKIRAGLAPVLPDGSHRRWDNVFGTSLDPAQEVANRASNGIPAETSSEHGGIGSETAAIPLSRREYMGSGYTTACSSNVRTSSTTTDTPTHSLTSEVNPWPNLLPRYIHEHSRRKFERRRRLLAIAESIGKAGNHLEGARKYVLGALRRIETEGRGDSSPERNLSAPGSHHKKPLGGNGPDQGTIQTFADVVSAIGLRIGKFIACRRRITAALSEVAKRQHCPASYTSALGDGQPYRQNRPMPGAMEVEI